MNKNNITYIVKKIFFKYKKIYNFIIGKIKYLKNKSDYKLYNLINNIYKFYNKYKNYKNNFKELNNLYNYEYKNKIKTNKSLILEINNNIKNIKNKINNIINNIYYYIKKIKNFNKTKKNINRAIIEIRSGTGGDEACIFVKDIFRMYFMYFKKNNINFKILNINNTNNGYREVILYIKKKNIYNYLKYESGIHRVQRIPKTETQGRLHTSAISVVVLPKIVNDNFKINKSDIKRYTFKSSGAGGQHVNKTESAIRLIHLPTKITVECQEERSQHKNYEKAITILKSKLYNYLINKKEKNIKDKRKLFISTGDRSNKIRTYNYPQNRVTDHRIKLTLYNLNKIMNGEINLIIDNFLKIKKIKI
ncbi:MAG: hypothetical protein RDO_1640 [Flavobacteriales endosymbiont of Rhyzopertha dominica]|nr:MAG: PCRF domain-containing protein [Candidatus Shikimatogenerans bostrichidophilus]